MIFTTVDFLTRAQVDRETLEIWIEEEWLLPSNTTLGRGFTEADLARAQLIRDLMNDLGINAEGVGVVLSLVDQVHSLRNVLAEVVSSARPRT